MGLSRTAGFDVLLVVLSVFSLGFVVLRVYSKVSRGIRLWWDDWLMVVCSLLLITNSSITIWLVSIGYGQHMVDINLANLQGLLKGRSAIAFLFFIGSAWSKTSFALTLFRLASGGLRWSIIFIIFAMNSCLTSVAMVTLLACNPIGAQWDLSLFATATCFDQNVLLNYAVTVTVISGFLELCLAILPWPLLLQHPTANGGLALDQKIGIALAMSFGIGSAIITFVKAAAMHRIGMNLDDIFYYTLDVLVLGTAEMATTIMAASIPTLRKFISINVPGTYSLKDRFQTALSKRSVASERGSALNSTTRPTPAQPYVQRGEQDSISVEAFNRACVWDTASLQVLEAEKWTPSVRAEPIAKVTTRTKRIPSWAQGW